MSENDNSKDNEPSSDEEEKGLAQSPDPDDEAFEEFLDELPPAIRKRFETSLSLSSFQSSIRPMEHPLLSKFNDAHIDKYLDYIQRDDDNAHELRKSNRNYYLAYFVITLIAFGAAIYFLTLSSNNTQLLQDLIKILAVFAGGFGTGYGVKARSGS